MRYLFNSFRDTISSQIISEIFKNTDFDKTVLVQISDSILATLLGGLLVKGDTDFMEQKIRLFGNTVTDELLTNPDSLLGIADDTYITNVFLDVVFDKKTEEIKLLVSNTYNIPRNQTKELLQNITHKLVSIIASKLLSKEYTLTGFIGQLYAERNDYLKYIPSGSLKVIGINSIANIGNNISADARVISQAIKYTPHNKTVKPRTEKIGFKWKRWLDISSFFGKSV